MTTPAAITALLARSGWDTAVRSPLTADASTRRYERLTAADGATAMLMIAPFTRPKRPLPPPYYTSEPEPFLSMSKHLSAKGFSAPQILDADRENGLILLEDLGDDLFFDLLADDREEEARLYAATVDVLVELSRTPLPKDPPPAYDLESLLFEARLAVQWYAPVQSVATDLAWSETLRPLLARVSDPVQPVLVLRDVHAQNLIWLPERFGLRRVGLLDYQDARIGHSAYDLVSLLEDARRDTDASLRAQMLLRFVERADVEESAFRQAYAILGAQRNLKIIGLFARLCLRDSKPGYLEHLPRVWDHLIRDLEHPALSDLRELVLSTLPRPDPDHIASLRARIGEGGSNA